MPYINIVRGKNLKKISKFINSNGEVLDGGVEEHLGNKIKNDLGRAGRPSETDERSEEKKK